MDFSFTEEQERFRKEVRDFLEQELKNGSYRRSNDGWQDGLSPQMSRKIGQKGWIGLTWPKEYGGQGKSYLDKLILSEELMRYGVPVAYHWVTERQVGPMIIEYGTEEQKRFFLPRIVKGELGFAVGFSEPEAGSDLASLRTKAVEKGDEFIVNGQKVWTSMAHECDYVYLVARTNTEVPKHQGISQFLVDLKLPGITIRPIIHMAGEHHFNEVFFDDVHVPRSCLLGEKDRGWHQIAAQLDYERSGVERLMGNYPLMHDTIEYVKQHKPVPPIVRYMLADLRVEYEVGRLLTYRVAWLLSKGTVPNYEAAMAKAFCTDFEQRLANVVTNIVGLHSQLMPSSKYALFEGEPAQVYLMSRSYSLGGGTTEILRNIVALRGLGLPAR